MVSASELCCLFDNSALFIIDHGAREGKSSTLHAKGHFISLPVCMLVCQTHTFNVLILSGSRFSVDCGKGLNSEIS